MAANEFNPSPADPLLRDYDALERDLQLGIGLAEARAERLMGEVFSYPHLAAQRFRKLSNRRGFAHAIAVLEQTTLRRELTFGVFRTGFLGWRRKAVDAAVGELPEALRDLKQLNERLGDVRRARFTVMRDRPAPVPEQQRVPQRRTRAQGRLH